MSATSCSWQTVLKWSNAMAACPSKRKAPAAIEQLLQCVDRRQIRNWRVSAEVYHAVKTEINYRFLRFTPSHALEVARLSPRSRWVDWVEEVEDRSLTVKGLRAAIEGVKTRSKRRPAQVARKKQKKQTEVLIQQGDCLEEMRKLKPRSFDGAFFSPPYPGIHREYGSWRPDEWLIWMQEVMTDLRRVIKPKGSVVVVLQPNNKSIGHRHTWPWQFAINMAEMWGIVQDAYWVKPVAFPTSEATQHGLMRTAVAWCLWLGNPKCYRNQKAVLWDYADGTLRDMARRAYLTDDLETLPHGGTKRARRMLKDNAGATPMNYFVCAPQGYDQHPACFPVKLAQSWIRYMVPPAGRVLDPFCGSATTGVACLAEGRSFMGIEKDSKYVRQARQRMKEAAL